MACGRTHPRHRCCKSGTPKTGWSVLQGRSHGCPQSAAAGFVQTPTIDSRCRVAEERPAGAIPGAGCGVRKLSCLLRIGGVWREQSSTAAHPDRRCPVTFGKTCQFCEQRCVGIVDSLKAQSAANGSRWKKRRTAANCEENRANSESSQTIAIQLFWPFLELIILCSRFESWRAHR